MENLPRMHRIRRTFHQPLLESVEVTLMEGLKKLPAYARLRPGANIAVTAGSRGIKDAVCVLRVLNEFLRERGANPFIVPAMGSHGGATAEGQEKLLAFLGVTEKSTGMPIRSSMETVLISQDSRGVPLYADRLAWESDGIILVNRIKPHTAFDGPVESGLFKMAVIGLGKHTGALSAHQAVLAYGYNQVIQPLGKAILGTGKILFGVALVENAFHQTAHVEAISFDQMEEREPLLLRRAKDYLPRLPFHEADVLLVDYMGKEISGSGMDTNVLGRRWFIGEPEPESPRIKRIILRDFTEGSGGNGFGIGLADFTTKRVINKINWSVTYTNAVTSKTPEKARLPIVCESDRQAVEWAFSTCLGGRYDQGRLCWISNTRDLEEICVSKTLLDEVLREPGSEVLQAFDFSFDPEGNLPFLFPKPAEQP